MAPQLTCCLVWLRQSASQLELARCKNMSCNPDWAVHYALAHQCVRTCPTFRSPSLACRGQRGWPTSAAAYMSGTRTRWTQGADFQLLVTLPTWLRVRYRAGSCGMCECCTMPRLQRVQFGERRWPSQAHPRPHGPPGTVVTICIGNRSCNMAAAQHDISSVVVAQHVVLQCRG